MQLFDRLPTVAELDGQPIEQFGMRGFAAHAAKIVGCLNKSLTEMIEPEAIDNRPPRQRIALGGDPACQGSTAFAFGLSGQRKARRQAGQTGNRTGTNLASGSFFAAATEEIDRSRFALGRYESACGSEMRGGGVDHAGSRQRGEASGRGLDFLFTGSRFALKRGIVDVGQDAPASFLESGNLGQVRDSFRRVIVAVYQIGLAPARRRFDGIERR